MQFPLFGLVKQIYPPREERDAEDLLGKELDRTRLLEAVSAGQSVLLTAGSRGIDCKPAVLAALVKAVKARGARPIIYPAMGFPRGRHRRRTGGRPGPPGNHGSHGGGTHPFLVEQRSHRGNRPGRTGLRQQGRGGSRSHHSGQPDQGTHRLHRVYRIRTPQDRGRGPRQAAGRRIHASHGHRHRFAEGHPRRRARPPRQAPHPRRRGHPGRPLQRAATAGGHSRGRTLRAGSRSSWKRAAITSQNFPGTRSTSSSSTKSARKFQERAPIPRCSAGS